MDELFRKTYRIPSARATWWDYGQNGVYFITICTHNREHYFGKVIADEMQLSDIGRIASECWMQIPYYFPFVTLDAFIVMPNHVHGIIIIDKDKPSTSDTENKFQPQSQNLASIVRGYKTGVTIKARNIHADFKWQPRFHEHIIRNGTSYNIIADYIVNNPLRWAKDKFHPDAQHL